MQKDYTFDDVKEFLNRKYGKKDANLVEALDVLAGVGIVLSPLVFGPIGVAALPFLGVKNELIKAGKYVVGKLTKAKDKCPLENYQRMQMAYTLICYTSFCDALDRVVPEIRILLGVKDTEEFEIAKTAREHFESRECEASEKSPSDDGGLCTTPIRFPHPTESFNDQQSNVGDLFTRLSREFLDFLQRTTQYEAVDDKTAKEVNESIDELKTVGLEVFRAQYVELARNFDDFFVWAMLVEDDQIASELRKQSEIIKRQLSLAEASKERIDIGFSSLHETIADLPNLLDENKVDRVIQALVTRYGKRLDDPIVKGEPEVSDGGPALNFPKICDIFIPQAFKAIRKSRNVRLEREETWNKLKPWDTLGPYLLHVLSSPYSIDQPLVVLGHPGSGKSLLTEVLATRLLCPAFFPIRVPLRDVNADADIQKQIEDWIREYTGEDINWTILSSRLQELNRPPLIILDGYDELLQASGKVFANYVSKVHLFLEREAEIGRPTRAVITSRMTLIDKADIPDGSTVIRLLEFDQPKRDRWVEIWNQKNKRYFDESGVRPFAVPEKNQKITELAEQPLLLLMLALYDSESNQLHSQKGLDQTVLYDDLLRRFIKRERTKGDAAAEFNALEDGEQTELISGDMERLGVAALGMFNRRSLHILRDQLNADIRFFDLEQPVPDSPGRALSQAEKLLGGFFFVHQSKTASANGSAKDRDFGSAFEFLHNTFGEFLAADFILRQVLTQTEQIEELSKNKSLSAVLAQKLSDPSGFLPEWYACLIYTPLHSRPVILEMARDWAKHCLKAGKRKSQAFLDGLDAIVENQLGRVLTNANPPQMFPREKESPFPQLAFHGHLAIYSLNLVLLRTVLAESEYRFEENRFAPHEDGTRPWDQLAHFWRSWFSLENLSGLTAIFGAKRTDDVVTLRARQAFSTAVSDDQLYTVLALGRTLADEITVCLAGYQLWNEFVDSPVNIDEIISLGERIGIGFGLPVVLAQLDDELPGRRKDIQEMMIAFERALQSRYRWTIADWNKLLRWMRNFARTKPFREVNLIGHLLAVFPWPAVLDHGDVHEVAELLYLSLEFSNPQESRKLAGMVVEHPRVGQFIVARPDVGWLLSRFEEYPKRKRKTPPPRESVATALASMGLRGLFRDAIRSANGFEVLRLMRHVLDDKQQTEFVKQATKEMRDPWGCRVLLELSRFRGSDSAEFQKLCQDSFQRMAKEDRLYRHWFPDPSGIGEAMALVELALETNNLDAIEWIKRTLHESKDDKFGRVLEYELRHADPIVARHVMGILEMPGFSVPQYQR